MAENGFSLKLVLFPEGKGDLQARLEETLGQSIPPRHILRLFDSALLIFTDADTSTVRDWLKPSLAPEDDLLVVEFEHWSSLGRAIDRKWLLWRGH